MAHRSAPALSGRKLLVGAALLFLAPMLTRCTEPIQLNTGVVALNNTAPVARITGGGDASIGSPLSLDGMTSYDPDGDEIIFHWTVDRKPEGSELSDTPFSRNGDRNAGTTSVVPDVEGVFVFALVVEDPDAAQSDAAFVVFEASSSVDLPIADAGPNRAGLEAEEICLDGAASYDPNAHPLTYLWELVSVPDASMLTTDDLTADAVEVCLSPDAPGSFALSLVVNNGIISSEPDFAFIAAGSTNQGPTAIADIVADSSCDFIELSGENSTDPESDALAYQWDVLLVPMDSQLPIGSAGFDDANSPTPRFYADVEGEYTVQLVVNDGEDYSTPVFVEINATPTLSNEPPVVVTSSDVYYQADGPTCTMDSYGNCSACPNCPSVVVPLDALSSFDPDEDPLSFTWEILTSPSNTTLIAEEGDMTELALPGPPGSCTPTINSHQAQVRVTAMDCSGATATGVVTIVYDCGP
jgi:hypothetical protein